MTEIIYSGSKVADKGGRKAVNPIYFTGPVEGVKTVFLNGDLPEIKAAYEEKGVKVFPLSEMNTSKKTTTEPKGA